MTLTWETELRRRIAELEREGVNAARELSEWKQSYAALPRQNHARVVKLEGDLKEAQATIRRLEHELAETKKLRYLPQGVVGP